LPAAIGGAVVVGGLVLLTVAASVHGSRRRAR
jgi:hypothetical protein